jgi:hypothetical protein
MWVLVNNMALSVMTEKRMKEWQYGRGHGGAVWSTPVQHHKPPMGPNILLGVLGAPWQPGTGDSGDD